MKTAAQLIADDSGVNLRDYFLKEGQKQPEGTKRRVNPKSTNQRRYLEAIEKDIVFGVGLRARARPIWRWRGRSAICSPRRSVASSWRDPRSKPARKLGFLPGDLQEKVNPYLRPLYDALYDMMDVERATRLVERGTIEVAPIAFMRGRRSTTRSSSSTKRRTPRPSR